MGSKEVTILFVDYSFSGFARYANTIIENIRALDSRIKIVAVYMDKKEDVQVHQDMYDVVVPARHYKNDAKRILDEFKPTGVVLFAHRFFDYMFTIEAHRKGIPVFNFQHGLYMDSTVISKLTKDTALSVLKKKRQQMILYIKCMYIMNQRRIWKTIGMMIQLVRYHSLYFVVNRRFPEICYADYSYVFGEYWKDYYRNQYLESGSHYFVVGYPELESDVVSTSDLFGNNLPIVCYLAQTSVEDGIISYDKLEKFLQVLEEGTERFNIVLKLHPRSDKAYYARLLGKKDRVAVWNQKKFPLADCYVGHESTVVARAMYLTSKTLVCRLSPERQSPFEKYARYVCREMSDLDSMLNEMIVNTESTIMSKDLSEYVYYNQNGSLQETARSIYDILNAQKGD